MFGFLEEGDLVVGAEPADLALGFFAGAFGVEGDEAFEDFGVGERTRPAVGFEDGGVEVVVELFEDGDEGFVVDVFFFGGEWLVGAEFFEDVVHPGEGEALVLRLDAFAVGVEFFGEFADAFALRFGAVGEWEWVKAAEALVARIITDAHASARLQSPSHVNSSGKHSKNGGIRMRNTYDRSIRHYSLFHKNEESML